MRRDNVATRGVGPVHEDVHIGIEGQLWVWEDGQTVISTSGAGAVQYATLHEWPDRLIRVLKSLDKQRKF